MPAYVAVVAALATVTGAVGWASHRLRHRAGIPLWLGLPLAWTAGEWLRAHLPGGLAFPWLELGTSLAAHPVLAGGAEVVGGRGLSLWLALVSGVVAGLMGPGGGRPRERASAFVGLALLVAVPVGWSVYRDRTLLSRPVARVAVVQPELAWEEKRIPREAAERMLEFAETWTETLAREGAELVVWPETALPLALDAPDGARFRGRIEAWSEAVGAEVLLGAFSGEAPGSRRFNSAFLFRPGGGGVADRYDKRRLVPGIEASAGVPWFARGEDDDFGIAPAANPGDEGVLSTRSLVIGVLICYESAFAGLAREARRDGAEILMNLTEEGWFGGAPGLGATGAIWQHPAHLVIRAIEERTGAVRAANRGLSFFVDPLGRVHDPLPRGRPSVKVASVRTTDVMTVYARVGDLAGTGAFVLVTLLALATVHRRRRDP